MKTQKQIIVILILILGCNISLVAQEYVEAENFNFKFIKAKKATGNGYYYAIKTDKDSKKVQVRFKLKSQSNELENFDPNKFYLIPEAYKVRVRPIDVRNNYAVGMIYLGFEYLVDFQPTDKNLKTWLSYNPEIKNTFYDYKIEGYEDVVPTINFGTKKKPKIASPYLGHKMLKSCKMDVYFSLPKDIKSFKVYYGKTLIVDTTIK